MADLIEGIDGFLYGTTSDGGPDNQVQPSSSRPMERPRGCTYFRGADGAGAERGALLQTSDASFYSTTAGGGASGLGRYSSYRRMEHSPSSIRSRAPMGRTHTRRSSAAPTEISSALTRDGGTYNLGTVFRMTPEPERHNLYSFTGGVDGGHPIAALTLATDGNLSARRRKPVSSTRARRSASRPSAVSRCCMRSAERTAPGNDGTSPRGRLLRQPRTAISTERLSPAAASARGQFSKMTPGGGVSLLHSLAGSPEGASPVARLDTVPGGSILLARPRQVDIHCGTVFVCRSDRSVPRLLHSFWDSNLRNDPGGLRTPRVICC